MPCIIFIGRGHAAESIPHLLAGTVITGWIFTFSMPAFALSAGSKKSVTSSMSGTIPGESVDRQQASEM